MVGLGGGRVVVRGVVVVIGLSAALVVGCGGDSGDSNDRQTSRESSAASTSLEAADVQLDPLLSVADVPEGFQEVVDGDMASGKSFSAVIDAMSCVPSGIGVEGETTVRFFEDDGVHGLLIDAGMARLADGEADRFFDALASEAPCERTSDGWRFSIEAPVTGPGAAVEIRTTRQQEDGLGELVTEQARFLRSGDVVGWVKARPDAFPPVADMATARFFAAATGPAGAPSTTGAASDGPAITGSWAVPASCPVGAADVLAGLSELPALIDHSGALDDSDLVDEVCEFSNLDPQAHQNLVVVTGAPEVPGGPVVYVHVYSAELSQADLGLLTQSSRIFTRETRSSALDPDGYAVSGSFVPDDQTHGDAAPALFETEILPSGSQSLIVSVGWTPVDLLEPTEVHRAVEALATRVGTS